MITAKQIIEEYEASRKIGRNYIEIFSNPSQSELTTFKGENIRFIADASSRKVYVANADKVIHYIMKDMLHLKPPSNITVFIFNGVSEIGCSYWLEGEAAKRGQSYKVTNLDQIGALRAYASGNIESEESSAEDAQKVLTELLERDWSWVDKYIEVTPYLRRVKR